MDSGFRRTSNSPRLEPVCINPQKEQTHVRGRNSLVYEGVGYPLPFFATPSLLCLKPHCDCNDPLPRCAPGAAIIVVIWGFSVSFWLFVLQEFGETRELEQAVETALPWESKSKRPPRWPFSYMWEIHLRRQVASRKSSASHIFYKFKKDQRSLYNEEQRY